MLVGAGGGGNGIKFIFLYQLWIICVRVPNKNKLAELAEWESALVFFVVLKFRIAFLDLQKTI